MSCSGGTRKAPRTLSSRSPQPKPDLLARSTLTRRTRAGANGLPRQRGDGAGQLGRLVEAPREEAPPVQRHRHDDIGLGDQLGAGPQHPACHPRREVGAVVVFQALHHLARDAGIGDRRTRPLEGRRVGDRLGRQETLAHVVRERRAHHRAPWPLEEAELRPAGAAQRAGLARPAGGSRRRPAETAGAPASASSRASASSLISGTRDRPRDCARVPWHSRAIAMAAQPGKRRAGSVPDCSRSSTPNC